MGKDKYSCISELQLTEQEGIDYSIRFSRRKSDWAVIAPHGGAIEPGTSEIALAAAGTNNSYYVFEGIKKSNNSTLHVTSEFFDEKNAIDTAFSAKHVITLHGCVGYDNKLLIGGLDLDNRRKLTSLLERADFDVDNDPLPELSGMKPENICNRGSSGCGIQVELDISIRKQMFRGLDRKGRKMPLPFFYEFISIIKGFIIK